MTFDAALDGWAITLAGHELAIRDSIVIDASALSSLTVDADNRSRVFYVTDDVTISGMTITGGLTRYYGGGIYSYGGTLTVTNSTLSGNSAHDGGGILSTPGSTLTVTNSIVALNDGGDIDGGLTAESGFNLIGVDPDFVRNPSDGDYGDLRLTLGSPALTWGIRM